MELEFISGEIVMVGKIEDIKETIYLSEVTYGIEHCYDGNVDIEETVSLKDLAYLPNNEVSIRFDVYIFARVFSGGGSGLWNGVHDLTKRSESDFTKLFAVRDFDHHWIEEEPW